MRLCVRFYSCFFVYIRGSDIAKGGRRRPDKIAPKRVSETNLVRIAQGGDLVCQDLLTDPANNPEHWRDTGSRLVIRSPKTVMPRWLQDPAEREAHGYPRMAGVLLSIGVHHGAIVDLRVIDHTGPPKTFRIHRRMGTRPLVIPTYRRGHFYLARLLPNLVRNRAAFHLSPLMFSLLLTGA